MLFEVSRNASLEDLRTASSMMLALKKKDEAPKIEIVTHVKDSNVDVT